MSVFNVRRMQSMHDEKARQFAKREKSSDASSHEEKVAPPFFLLVLLLVLLLSSQVYLPQQQRTDCWTAASPLKADTTRQTLDASRDLTESTSVLRTLYTALTGGD